MFAVPNVTFRLRCQRSIEVMPPLAFDLAGSVQNHAVGWISETVEVGEGCVQCQIYPSCLCFVSTDQCFVPKGFLQNCHHWASRLFLSFYLTFQPKTGISATAALRGSCLGELCSSSQSQMAWTNVLTIAYKSRAGAPPVPGKLVCLFQVRTRVPNIRWSRLMLPASVCAVLRNDFLIYCTDSIFLG